MKKADAGTLCQCKIKKVFIHLFYSVKELLFSLEFNVLLLDFSVLSDDSLLLLSTEVLSILLQHSLPHFHEFCIAGRVEYLLNTADIIMEVIETRSLYFIFDSVSVRLDCGTEFIGCILQLMCLVPVLIHPCKFALFRVKLQQGLHWAYWIRCLVVNADLYLTK